VQPIDREELFNVTIPAGTSEATPFTGDTTFKPGTVLWFEIVYPDGPCGFTGIRVCCSGTQLMPTTTGTWWEGNNERLYREVLNWPNSGRMELVGYNVDVNNHLFQIRYGVVENEPSTPPPAAPPTALAVTPTGEIDLTSSEPGPPSGASLEALGEEPTPTPIEQGREPGTEPLPPTENPVTEPSTPAEPPPETATEEPAPPPGGEETPEPLPAEEPEIAIPGEENFNIQLPAEAAEAAGEPGEPAAKAASVKKKKTPAKKKAGKKTKTTAKHPKAKKASATHKKTNAKAAKRTTKPHTAAKAHAAKHTAAAKRTKAPAAPHAAHSAPAKRSAAPRPTAHHK